jgi:hypothetical protein
MLSLVCALILTAPTERALVIAREGDAWSLLAAKQLEVLPPKRVLIVPALEKLTEEVDGVSFVPVHCDVSPDHQPRAIRDDVQQRLFEARSLGDENKARSVIVEALKRAREMPISEPERRGLTIRQALRELVTLLVREGNVSSEVRALVSELVVREAGGAPTTHDKALQRVYDEEVKLANEAVRSRVQIVSDAPEIQLALNGTDASKFGTEPSFVARTGTHELVALSAKSPLWVRRFALGPKGRTIRIDLELESSLALTPSAVWVRRNFVLSPLVAKRLAERANVDFVWLVEKSDPQSTEATVRIYPRDGSESRYARLKWPSDKAGAANEVPIELVSTASNTASTNAQPTALRHYQFKMPSPDEFVFTPYDGDWRPEEPWFKKWWVWTLAGAVITGAVVGGVLYATRDDGNRAYTPVVTLP